MWNDNEAKDEDFNKDDEIVKAMMDIYDGILCLSADTWLQGIPRWLFKPLLAI